MKHYEPNDFALVYFFTRMRWINEDADKRRERSLRITIFYVLVFYILLHKTLIS